MVHAIDRIRDAYDAYRLGRDRRAGRWVELTSPFGPAKVLTRLEQVGRDGNVEPPVQLPHQRTYGRVNV
jgi:hypothetical protein